mmetsp:Transcript_28595/g.32085  ORF Transcript_28595/g.32085 Transcript_28595/m.32085 type:complete len:503 (+) Transcript_28595:109-1617(+)
MPCLNFLPYSLLWIGCLSFLVNGLTFRPIKSIRIAPTIQQLSMLPPGCNTIESNRRCWCLHAVKVSKKTSSSDKIQEMASFLSRQLLDKIMAEAMKEDGESTMDIKAVQRILDALQYQPITNSGTKHEEDRVVGGEKSETTTISQAAVGEKAISKESSVSTTKDATKSTEIPTLTQSEMQQSLVDPILKSKNTDKENFLKEDDTIESVPSSMTPKSVVRPHLEVIASDLPPLRPSSVPKRKSKLAIVIEEDDDQSKIIMEDKASSLLEEQEKKETQTIDDSNEGDIINSLVSILKQQIPGELFQRSLLKQKFEYDALARVAVVENDDDDGYFDPNNETKADEALSTSPTRQVKNILKDSESTPSASVEDIVVEEKTNKGKEESSKNSSCSSSQVGSTTPKSEGKVLQSSSSDVTSQSSQLGFPPLITTTSPTIFERVSDTIVARSQPKSPDEESKLADRYASMSVEERAFAVLFDPGMIKKNKDPKDPSYDHTHDDEYCDQT